MADIRVAAYVDGFNLYHGMRDAYGRRYFWLDLQALATSMLKPNQRLVRVTYCTARVRDDPAAERRQSLYLRALATRPAIRTIQGRFQEKNRACHGCGRVHRSYEEKESDVSFAVALLEDAVLDLYDTALLITGDSDLCPAVRATRRVAPSKRLVAVSPPKRHSAELRRVTDGQVFIAEANLRQSQLPKVLLTARGPLARPTYWS